MAFVLFGKAAATVSSALFSGLIALLVAWWLARDLIEVADPALLALSVCVAIVAIIATGFIWAPLFVLVGDRPGFFNAIIPFAVVFGGFIVPIDFLSPTGEAVARALPTAWTSEAIYYSIRDGSPEAGRILANLGVALGDRGVVLRRHLGAVPLRRAAHSHLGDAGSRIGGLRSTTSSPSRICRTGACSAG